MRLLRNPEENTNELSCPWKRTVLGGKCPNFVQRCGHVDHKPDGHLCHTCDPLLQDAATYGGEVAAKQSFATTGPLDIS